MDQEEVPSGAWRGEEPRISPGGSSPPEVLLLQLFHLALQQQQLLARDGGRGIQRVVLTQLLPEGARLRRQHRPLFREGRQLRGGGGGGQNNTKLEGGIWKASKYYRATAVSATKARPGRGPASAISSCGCKQTLQTLRLP